MKKALIAGITGGTGEFIFQVGIILGFVVSAIVLIPQWEPTTDTGIVKAEVFKAKGIASDEETHKETLKRAQAQMSAAKQKRQIEVARTSTLRVTHSVMDEDGTKESWQGPKAHPAGREWTGAELMAMHRQAEHDYRPDDKYSIEYSEHEPRSIMIRLHRGPANPATLPHAQSMRFDVAGQFFEEWSNGEYKRYNKAYARSIEI